MKLREVQKAAWPEEIRHHLGPPTYVGEPYDGAATRVDDVEDTAARGAHGLVDVRVHERGLEAHLGGQTAGRLHGGGREVEASYSGAAAGPAQGVDPEVALEMHQLLARYITDLVYLERLQALLTFLERRDVVELSRDVNRDTLVPVGPVRLPPLLAPFTHRSLLSQHFSTSAFQHFSFLFADWLTSRLAKPGGVLTC